MPKYLLDSFRGGISEEGKRGIRGSYKFGYGLDIRSDNDFLTCNWALVKESGSVVVDKVNFIVPCTDGNSYYFGDNGKIYKRKVTTWTLEYTDANGKITGAVEWNGYLYWACTNGKISRIAVSDADSSNWASGVTHDWATGLTSGVWHTMKVASGELLICNGQYLAMIDYSATLFTAIALDLIPGNIAQALNEYGDYVIIGSKRKSEEEAGYIWSWNANLSLNWDQKIKIGAKGINALITSETMLAQAGIFGGVYYSNLVNKDPLFLTPGGGYSDPGGVDVRKNIALFGISRGGLTKGGIFGYRKRKKNQPMSLSLDYIPSIGMINTLEVGAVQMVNGTLLVGWKNTTGPAYGVDALSTTVKATAVYESLEFDAGYPDFKKHFREVKITLNPLPAGCSIVLKQKVNGASSWTTVKTIKGASIINTTGVTVALFMIDKQSEVIELQLTLTPNGSNAPEIKSVATEFDFMTGGDVD